LTVCAYCKQDKPATREHVIPSFLYVLQKSLGDKVIGWNEVAEKMVGGESKVKDVCADCNNGVLSELDAYGKQLLGDAGLLVHNFLGNSIRLRYEYGPLLRWLLKISFNSSRTDRAHSYLFEAFIPFILGQEATPPRSRVALLAYLASAVDLKPEQRGVEPFRTSACGALKLNPLLVRVCYGLFPSNDSFTLRIVILGPLVFFLPIFEPAVLPGHAAAALRQLQKAHPGAAEISAKKRLMTLHAGAHTWMDLYADQVQRARRIAGEAPRSS
jgi:hypothetical protein